MGWYVCVLLSIIIYLQTQEIDTALHVIIAPKGPTYCVGVSRNLCSSVHPSVRDEICTRHKMIHRFERLPCNADDQGPKIGRGSIRAKTRHVHKNSNYSRLM